MWYLSKEVADDGVGQGVSQTAELMGGGHTMTNVLSLFHSDVFLFVCVFVFLNER